MVELGQRHHLVIAFEQILIRAAHLEFRKVEADHTFLESVADQRASFHILGIVGNILVADPIFQYEDQHHFIGGFLHDPGFGRQHHIIPFHGAVIINHHIFEALAILAFFIDADAEPLDAVIEYPFFKKQGRLRFADIPKQCAGPEVGERKDVVGKIESGNGKYDDRYDQRRHHLLQGQAGAFHGRQLKMLTEVAEGHERGKQDRQRKRHRNGGKRKIKEQLRKNSRPDAFPYKIINVFENEHHKEDEHRYEKGHDERTDIGFQDEFVKRLHVPANITITMLWCPWLLLRNAKKAPPDLFYYFCCRY